MGRDMKRQAILDFEEATAANGVVRGPKSMNLMLYSAAQVEALCRIGKEVLALNNDILEVEKVKIKRGGKSEKSTTFVGKASIGAFL